MTKKTTSATKRRLKRTGRKARRMASSTYYITLVTALGFLVVIAA